MISRPKQVAPYLDRDLDCQQALESTFNQVLLLAEQYGWHRTSAAQAFQELAFAHMAAEEEQRLITLSIDQLGHAKH